MSPPPTREPNAESTWSRPLRECRPQARGCGRGAPAPGAGGLQSSTATVPLQRTTNYVSAKAFRGCRTPRRTRAVQEICQQPPPGHRASPQPERSPRRAGGRQAAPGAVTASLRAPRRVGPGLEARLSRGLSWGRGGHEEAPGGPCGRSLGRKRQVAPGGGVSAGAWSPISSRATESPLHGRRPGLRRGRARPGPASRAPTRLPRRRRLNAGRAAVLAGDDGLCSGPAASAGCPGPRRSHRSLD